MSTLLKSVRELYEAFPYPHYPLLARPLWQDGYSGSSFFSARLLLENAGLQPAILRSKSNGRHILCAGSGEIQPYVMRRLEPFYHELDCVDLSARSLKRAKRRLLLRSYKTQLIRSDINDYLSSHRVQYDHIDAYGVLHHLPDPAVSLKLLARSSQVGTTLRVMIYNPEARRWIHQFQRAFSLLGLSPYSRRDRKKSREFLLDLSEHAPSLKKNLAAIGRDTWLNTARYVDMFHHTRETKISFIRWFDLFRQAGWTPFAVFDRAGGFDDLDNPLLEVPGPQEVHRRAKAGGFRHNLELFLVKSKGVLGRGLTESPQPPLEGSSNLHFLLSPPSTWFNYVETSQLGFLERQKLWWSFLRFLHYGLTEDRFLESFALQQKPRCLQRLARLGVLFPGMFASRELKDLLRAPMIVESVPHRGSRDQLSLSSVKRPQQADFQRVRAALARLGDKKNVSSRRRNLAELRVLRALFPGAVLR